MFEVLVFLIENYLSSGIKLPIDNVIATELERIGFDRYEIGKALDWLEGLTHSRSSFINETMITTPHAIRNYLPEEVERLGVEGMNFLTRLQQIGAIDLVTQEIVIDSLMALEVRTVELGRVKWVTLVALFSQPDKKKALLELQDMIMADAFDQLH